MPDVDGAPRGIRLAELDLGGLAATGHTYSVSFRRNSSWRPLSVIAGPSQTGKTTIIDFIRYCLGDDAHPQHPEVLASVRTAILETTLAGEAVSIERAAAGVPSHFASVWQAPLSSLRDVPEMRLAVEPPSDPQGLSQYVLAACGLDNIALPTAPTQAESATQTLSIRDLFRVMWLPNERLDSKNLLFEHANHMVTQKFRQTIDVMFNVHDAEGNDLAARIKLAAEAFNEASRAAKTLRDIVQQEHPQGPSALESQRDQARRDAAAATDELRRLDVERAAGETGLTELRQALAARQKEARTTAIRVRNRESLVERLAALRSQYADDKKKLTFLSEAERLFDPLRVTVCPACLSEMDASPTVMQGACSLCGQHVPQPDGTLELQAAVTMNDASPPESRGDEARATAIAVLQAELRATTRRLNDLNDYWTRLDEDLELLRKARADAERGAEEAAFALDRVVDVPAPYLAARDELARRRSEALLHEQKATAGLRLWDRVRAADDKATLLGSHATRLRAERREANVRPNRTAVIAQLSRRFGEVLHEIGYPKLSSPYLDDRLMPFVRGLPYAVASSGGQVLISLAWYLALWEVAYEEAARAPGLLIIDSPQKNLGHAAHPDDPDFADSRLVENFYKHAKTWLTGPGSGAQLIVVDNSPPESVANDVIVRYTRNRSVPPYGLIEDAID